MQIDGYSYGFACRTDAEASPVRRDTLATVFYIYHTFRCTSNSNTFFANLRAELKKKHENIVVRYYIYTETLYSKLKDILYTL